MDSKTVLLGQFELDEKGQIQSIETYGRVVTGGDAFYAVYSDAGTQPGSILASATATFPAMRKLQWYGVYDLTFNLLKGVYWVGVGSVPGSTFTSFVVGSAPNALGREGSFKLSGLSSRYVAANGVDLSWRISGASITSAIPEPATWAMMISGFGLIGAAMRRARRRNGPRLALA